MPTQLKYSWLLLLLFLAGCDKLNLADLEDEEEGYSVTFNIGQYDISDFDDISQAKVSSPMNKVRREAKNLGSVINVAVFQDGEKVKTMNQTSSDDDFGTVSLSLPAGSYQVVFLVHSCSGNATITSPDKVTFPSNKVTDTFSCYTDITVDKDNSYDISVNRSVSMFRLTLEDAVPSEVTRFKFYYTGGSSTLDAETNFGCVNSRQTEYRDVTTYDEGQSFDIYTFPHDETDELTLTVSALDAKDNTVKEVQFEGIPVEIRKKTTHTINFFGEYSNAQGSMFTLYGDDEWKGDIEY